LIRIGQAASGQFNIRGFHATSVIGVFAAAAVAGKLLGLTSEQLTMAFGIAGSQAAGLLESEMDGSWVKRFHPGWASHAGIIAASMAKKGFTGPQTVFEGQFGLFNSHIGDGNYDLERIAEGLGERWELLDVCFKPYACCHYNHAFMDCALYLKQEHGLNLAEITEIECKMHPAQAKEMCEPLEIKRVPRTEYEAKFSLPYCVAVMLAREDGGIEQFTMENVSDPLILELTKKFRCTPYADPAFPKSYPGWVIIRTRDGRTYEKRMAETRGTKANPMSLDELNKKFSSNAVRAVKSERAELISRVIGRFERVSEPRELIELLKADQD
jgi:2-methylcitrate dehydratase PrpD